MNSGSFREQVSLIHALAFVPFRLQTPYRVPPTSLFHATPQLVRPPALFLRVWVSLLGCKLTEHSGRIEFVILRTGTSLPVASYLASRRRSYF